MENIYCENITKIKKQKKFLEEKLNIKIRIKGKRVTISGDSLDEYEAALIIDAISLGFSPKTAVLLKEEDIIIEKINRKK